MGNYSLLYPVNSKRTGTLTQYNSPYNRTKPIIDEVSFSEF